MKKVKKSPSVWVHQAQEAFRKAVAEAIAEHRRNGIPIAIWRNGKVVRIPVDQIEVREPQVVKPMPNLRKTLRGSLKGKPSMSQALIREHKSEVKHDEKLSV